MVSSVGGGEGSRPTNEITILEVKAVQLVASLLSIHHVLVDYESRALGVVCDSLADLTRWSVRCER